MAEDDRIVRSESTEIGKRIWEEVKKAASRAPEWVKEKTDSVQPTERVPAGGQSSQ